MKLTRETAEDGAKRYRIETSGLGLAGAGAILVLGLVWVFIFGVLVGRGYQPEKDVPELARFMPPTENATTAPKAPEEVIKAEELTFHESLKEEGESAPAPKLAPAPAPASKPETAARPEPAPKPAPQETSEPAHASETDERFVYVYQVGSFKKPAMAEDFRAKVAALGHDASIEEAEAGGTTWRRVLVRHTGTPASTRALKEDLAALGVAKPLMRSKKPLP